MRVSAVDCVFCMPKRLAQIGERDDIAAKRYQCGRKDSRPATRVTGTGSMISRPMSVSMAKISLPSPTISTMQPGFRYRAAAPSLRPSASPVSEPGSSRGLRGSVAFGTGLSERHELGDVEDQRAEPSPRMVAPENIVTSEWSLDSDLIPSGGCDDLIDHEDAARVVADRGHDDLLMGIRLALRVEEIAQAHEGHELAAHIEGSCGLGPGLVGRGELDTLSTA